MSRQSHAPELLIVPLWTRAKIEKAAPYFASMLRTLRQAALEAKEAGLTAERLSHQPGRPDRAARIAHANALRDAGQAGDALRENMEELQALGVHCPDAMRGEALIPFDHEQQLAWFVYDLFAEEPLRQWRFHTDPPEMRRSIEEIAPHTPAIPVTGEGSSAIKPELC